MDARSPTRPGGWAPRALGHLRKWLREPRREWGGFFWAGERALRSKAALAVTPDWLSQACKLRPLFAPHVCKSRPSRALGRGTQNNRARGM
jgi:hypothetical protein